MEGRDIMTEQTKTKPQYMGVCKFCQGEVPKADFGA
jgi:hypothetical protein